VALPAARGVLHPRPGCPYNATVKATSPRPVSAYNPSLDNLRSLLLIRSIALLGQTGVLLREIDEIVRKQRDGSADGDPPASA